MLTPKVIKRFIDDQYSKYNEGIINDIDFAGGIFEQCKSFLEQEQEKYDKLSENILDILDY